MLYACVIHNEQSTIPEAEEGEGAENEETGAPSAAGSGEPLQAAADGVKSQDGEKTVEEISDEPGEVELTEYEENIRNYLVEDEPLPDGVVSKLLGDYWYKEPYK